MAEQHLPPPKGIKPIFLRGQTMEKFGLKTGPSVNDVVDYKFLPKADIQKDIQTFGALSEFEPAKKEIESYPGDQILIVIDRDRKYGESCLICFTDEAKEEIMKGFLEQQEALQAQLREEMRLEEERKAAEYARLNVVYEDKPLSPRTWHSSTSAETETEVRTLTFQPAREMITIEISRPKRQLKQPVRFFDRNADVGPAAEFKSTKDSNFKLIREADRGIQVAPMTTEAAAQTTYYRAVSKAVQHETTSSSSSSATTTTTTSTSTSAPTEVVTDKLLAFLEVATVRIEQALQQNESVDIFHDTFRLLGDEEGGEGVQSDNELQYLKNFADANYSKNKPLVVIDWMPKATGMVAVSAVRNVSFDQRIPLLGQTHTSFVLLWDFRLLVKPLVIMQSHHEIFSFRFNRVNPHIAVGGCITGQVVLWEIGEAVNSALGKSAGGGAGGGSQAAKNNNDEDIEDISSLPIQPKYVSHVDYSHKRCVSDLFWLPPTTQINFRGQLVGKEHLDGQSYQFITVAGDGMMMVWDTRFERIFNDELRHIGRVKHIPTEKSSAKDGGGLKPLWAPLFRAHLKRLEGVGELSLCRVCEIANSATTSQQQLVGKQSSFPGDCRAQFMVATEEGDIIFADLAARKGESSQHKEEEEEEESEFSCVKWITMDHARPAVHLQESPFFPQIVLSISDWNFHIWKIGEDRPLFTSPQAHSYLTAGCWSNTRPAVILIACADGQLLVWDFTDSSFRHSLQLKATSEKITSMELLTSSTAKYQLLAVGDGVGTLHIHEMPYNLTKKVNREEIIMQKFLERELQRIELAKALSSEGEVMIGAGDGHHHDGLSNGNTRPGTADENAMGMTAAATSQPGTAAMIGGRPSTADGNNNGEHIMTAAETKHKADLAALHKEEEEFLKLESIYISEMGEGGAEAAIAK